jgi:hypothetical protein
MKKNTINIFIILTLLLILLKNFDLFRKGYFVLTRDYDQRFNESYEKNQFSGFCSKESHGYVHYIKKKYKDKISPEIINLGSKSKKLPYWIFYNLHGKINKDKLIILNYDQSKSSLIKSFIVIDNYNNQCLYLEKKNGNS